MNKFNFILLVFLSIVGLGLSVQAEEPLPPAELIDWLDYSLKRFPPEDCPNFAGTKTCAAVTAVEFSGDLQSGRIQVTFTGYNWSRTDQEVALLGPSSSFSLENSSVSLSEQFDPEARDAIFMAPFFKQSGKEWRLKVPPAKFRLTSTLVFQPKGILPLNLAEGVGRIQASSLTGGFIQFDENQGNHGGEMQFVLAGKRQKVPEKPRVRVTRVFSWGSIPTFEYVIQVNGLRSELPISVPLLANEVIENVSPEKPYTTEVKSGVRYFSATFSPGTQKLKLKGHYKTAPSGFKLGDDLPFEIWIHVGDRRFPVNIDTNAKPIDPSEFTDVVSVSQAKAFMVKPGQKLNFQKVDLAVDEGRQGKGVIAYQLYEGTDQFWVEKLFLKAQILGQDRLVIPTVSSPTYAGIGQEGIELFHDGVNQLSVRLPTGGLQDKLPIEVDWTQKRESSWFLGQFKSDLPAQNVYLEKQTVNVHFRPGVIPLYAWGGETASGDLLDQFHLYGFLLGIFAFFICRGLKFGWPLCLFVTVLFIGLYLEKDFPTTAVLVLLLATLPLVHLKEGFWEKLKTMPIRRRLLTWVWGFIFLVTVIPLSQYGRTRVFEALHPYAGQQTSATKPRLKSYGNFGDGAANMEVQQKQLSPSSVVSHRSFRPLNKKGNYQKFKRKKIYKVSEWNAKPVSLDVYTRGGRDVEFTSYNVLPGKASSYRILTVGPIVRGFWMLIEVGLVLWMMLALLARSKRLFW